jgi:putative ABC transport system permease protein
LPVAIINQAMAKAYWPREDPIGKKFRFKSTDKWLTVVGLTGNMRRQGIERAVAPQVFLPRRQGIEDMMDVIVRTSADPMAIAGAIRSRIQAIDKTVARFNIATVDQQLGEQTAERQFDTFLISTFAFAAVFLSAIGIYGLLHQMVVQRRNELGVRLALGATRSGIASLVVREGLTLALTGSVTGLVSALFLSRLLSKLLYGVTPTDPITFAGALLVLLAVAAIACWIPSYRATRIDPMIVLRQE